MDKHINVSITPGAVIKTILIVVAAYVIWLLRDLLLLILTAIVIASAIEPGVAWVVRQKVPRILAVLMMYLTVFGSLFAVVYFFFLQREQQCKRQRKISRNQFSEQFL